MTVGNQNSSLIPSIFSEEELLQVDRIIDHYHSKPGALIPVLEDVQEILGHLPATIQKRIATRMGIPLAEVHGVVSFYSFFTMVPKGRHVARCCLGTACYVRGGKHNMKHLKEILAIDSGGTTGDGKFSLETVRCLGACGLAPVMTVDEDTYRQVKPSRLSDILERYE